MSVPDALWLVLGGLLATVINTLAGGGSLLTLALLLFVGDLSAVDANGTNRLAVLVGSLTASARFARQGALPRSLDGWDAAAACVGAALGALASLPWDEQAFRRIIGVVLLGVLGVLLGRPTARLAEASPPASRVARTLTYLGIGFYGGFIQAGVGVILGAAGVLVSGLRLADAQAAKVAIVLLYTVPALGVFWWTDHVRWAPGLWLAAGAVLGGIWGARLVAALPAWALKAALVVGVGAASFRLLVLG